MFPQAVSDPESMETAKPKDGVELRVYKKPRRKVKRTKKQIEFLKKLKDKPKKPDEYTVDEEMTALGIPPFLQHAYLNGIPQPTITKLRDWQIELCKSESWKNRDNTVILVPTSGGKTVAADLAIADELFKDKKSKIIYALPFVALANEKYTEYEQRFFEFQVRPYYQNIGGSDFRRGNIAICTYEKAHALINAAISGGYHHQIKLIVIDEVHMLGDESRGATIEALILKAKLMNNKPRIITLTATINDYDAKKLAAWIRGVPFIWKARPTPIKQIIKKMDGSLNVINNDGKLHKFVTVKSVPEDKDHLMPLIRTLLSKKSDSSLLVFVNSRNETISTSFLVAKYMYNDNIGLPKLPPPSEELIAKRNKLIKDLASNSGILDENVANCIKAGVLFHHAGLLMEDRKLIEQAARDKVINVLIATTTLSAGVNIHGVARVIINGIYRFVNRKKVLIPESQFTQMVGRAGRSGLPGEAYIIAKYNTDREINDIIKLSKNVIPNITSHLLDGETTDRFFLQCLAIKLVNPDNGLRSFVENGFVFAPDPDKQPKNEEQDFLSKFEPEDQQEVKIDPELNAKINELCVKVSKRMKEDGVIDEEMRVTKFGMAVAGSSLSVDEGKLLKQMITKTEENLCISDEIHLLSLCVSSNSVAASVKSMSYDSDQWIKIFHDHKHVIRIVTGMKEAQIAHMEDLAKIYGNGGKINAELDNNLDRIFCAVILKELINETPLKTISRNYMIDFGTIQKLQLEAATYAGQINRFCEIIGSAVLAAALNKFRQRLNFAARTDLLALMSIPSCSREIARKLVDKNINSPIDLSVLTIQQIATLIANEGEDNSEDNLSKAARLLKDAKVFAESLEKIEELEDKAVLNYQ